MVDKKKKRRKIKSLEKQKQEHSDKIRDYEGKNYALIEYWKKEIENIESEIDKEKEELDD